MKNYKQTASDVLRLVGGEAERGQRSDDHQDQIHFHHIPFCDIEGMTASPPLYHYRKIILQRNLHI